MRTAELVAQIRFQLSELTVRNAAHEFEEACRQFTRLRIASNVLPASGPVGALGDQGRDFETFRSYLRDELGPNGGFLALVSDGPAVFACTIKQDDLKAKVLGDVAAITAQGTSVARIYFFSVGSIAVGVRHALQAEASKDYGVVLEIIDGAALAEQLADPDLFWIATQYLRLPAEMAPRRSEVEDDGDGTPGWYLEDRERWRERGKALPTLGHLLDLRDGLRYAANHRVARADLPYWLGLMSDLIDDASDEVSTRARYEVAIAQIRGFGDLAPADEHVKTFIEQGMITDDPARLADCSVLLSYATLAFASRQTQLTREQLVWWSDALRARVRELLPEAQPVARARLLEVLGNLCFAVDPGRAHQASEPHRLPEVSEFVDEDGKPRFAKSVSPELAEQAMVDVNEGMEAWLELAENLPNTPLFPLESLARMLEVLAPLLVEQRGWRRLTDAVDAALADTQGSAAAAERNYGRARSLLGAEHLLDAIAEVHQAKISWWSGDHLRPSLMMLLLLSDCYAELGMSLAAKQYALAAATIPVGTGTHELLDIVPHALIRASMHDYGAGSWCSAVQLARLGTVAQRQFTDESVDKWAESDSQSVIFTIGMSLLAAQALFEEGAPITQAILAIAEELEMREDFEKATRDIERWPADQWVETCREQLLGDPFEDTGRERIIRFAALGLRFVVRCENVWSHVLAAERLVAAVQVLLVELAGSDLCLLPTEIELLVTPVATGTGGFVNNVSSNDGRRWEVRLTEYAPPQGMDVEAVSLELLTVLSQVLLDVSMLPTGDFMAAVEQAFEAGLPHKLTAGRPYDELARIVDREAFEQIPRESVEPPAGTNVRDACESELLMWQDGPGPTVSQEELDQLIENRYENLCNLMPRTLPRLVADGRFRTTVALLRQRGWKDWHILTAVYNILVNRRLAHAGLNTREAITSSAGSQAIRELAFRPEDENDPEVPLGIFINIAKMDEARKGALSSLLMNLELEIHSQVPDLPAIERLLAARYGYWSDDAKHEDPFACG